MQIYVTQLEEKLREMRIYGGKICKCAKVFVNLSSLCVLQVRAGAHEHITHVQHERHQAIKFEINNNTKHIQLCRLK